jgi:hypothetical protein
VETAANQRQIVITPALDLVRELWPELWHALETDTDEVRERVCEAIAPQARATRRLIDFLVEFAPEPPLARPPFGALDWDRMPSHAGLIYGHRSRYLHDGKPFPLPMLEVPRTEENGATQEVPYGLNSAGLGGRWEAAEAPMPLATFEHIARGALLRWWDDLAE